MNQWIRNVIVICVLLMLVGCGHSMRGKVIRGDRSGIEVVHASDPRLQTSGISGVDVRVQAHQRDAGDPELTAKQWSNAAGEFSMRLDDLASVSPHREWLVQARMRGYQSASGVVKLPAATRWHVLITLTEATGAAGLDEVSE